MKPLVKPVAYLLFAWLISLLSCKKEKVDEDSLRNHPPLANAGADVTVNITSCSSGRSAELDGSGSYDPDEPGDKVYYEWTKISGPRCDLSNSVSTKPLVFNLSAGQYAFELKVTDVGGLSSKDTVVVNVTGSTAPQEINMDATINGTFTFNDNFEECHLDGWYFCFYYDLTTAEGVFDLSPIGQISVGIYEKADSVTTNDSHDSRIGFTCINCAPPSRDLRLVKMFGSQLSPDPPSTFHIPLNNPPPC